MLVQIAGEAEEEEQCSRRTRSQANRWVVRHESETGKFDEISPRHSFVQARAKRPVR